MNEKLMKLPWGIFIGTFILLFFYDTVGVIVALIVTNGIASATNEATGLFSTPWQTLMFVFDIVFFIGLAFSVVMYVLKKKAIKGKTETEAMKV